MYLLATNSPDTIYFPTHVHDSTGPFPFSAALLYGIMSMVMAFLAKNMGGVVQVTIGVAGGCTGPLLAIFTLALFVPFSNTKVRNCSPNPRPVRVPAA